MATFGKVRDVTAEFHFEWQIDDFFSLPEKDEKHCLSPSFSFAGESWYFKFYPNGHSENNSVGYIGAYLQRKLDGLPISVAWSLGVKTVKGKTYYEMQCARVYEKAVTGWGFAKFLLRSHLSVKKSELVPSDVLTLVCHIDYYSKSKDGAENTLTVKCSYCKETLVAECASSHEKKCLDKPIRCPTCSDVVALRAWFDHECDTLRVKDMKEGAPLVIKGIVKGSAAHRSGQVFPKDEIRSLKYKGKEIYDPLTSDFTRERTVILTIMRDLRKEEF